MKPAFNVIGVCVALAGLVWFLQGIGVLQGSIMSNQPQWVLIGLLGVALGSGVLFYNNRRRAQS